MIQRRDATLFRQMSGLFGRGAVAGMEEGRLLERFAARGDEEAFEALVSRFGPMVLGVCSRMLDDPNDVDDAFQATFLILVKKAASLRDGDLVGNWLYGVACRVAARARAAARRRHRREVAWAEDEAMARSRSHAQGAEWHDLRRVLDEELGRLPETLRAPVYLCCLQEQSYEEAAKRLKWPIGTVRSRLSRARELMRSRLARRGFALPAGLLAAALQPKAAQAAPSAALLERTIRTAMQALAGKSALAAGGSAAAARLAREVMRSMLLVQLKAAAGVALIVGAAGTGAVVLGRLHVAEEARRAAQTEARADHAPAGLRRSAPGGGPGQVDPAPAAAAAAPDARAPEDGRRSPARRAEATDAGAAPPGAEVAEAVGRLVAQLKQHPARPSLAAERDALYLLPADGGDATLIADEPAPGLTHCGSPSWSPDGRQILFDATPKNQWERTRLESIALVEDGLIRADLGPGNCASLSPDGRQVAFLMNSGAAAGAAAGVWLMGADGSGRRLLGAYGRVKWGPDPRRVLLVAFSTPPKPTTLSLLDVETGGTRSVAVPGQKVFSVPSWAGAGRLVAAIGAGEFAERIALLDVTGPGDATVAEVLWTQQDSPALSPAYPVYSAATGRCVFVGESRGAPALYAVEGGRPRLPRRLEPAVTARTITDVALSPDGRYIIFCSGRPKR